MGQVQKHLAREGKTLAQLSDALLRMLKLHPDDDAADDDTLPTPPLLFHAWGSDAMARRHARRAVPSTARVARAAASAPCGAVPRSRTAAADARWLVGRRCGH